MPRLEQWSLKIISDAEASCMGTVFDSPSIANGTDVVTSSIALCGATPAPWVQTASGSVYTLGKCKPEVPKALASIAACDALYRTLLPLQRPFLPSIETSSPDKCAICLEPTKLGKGEGRALFDPGCGHVFHFSCIASSYLSSHSAADRCPLCRRKMDEPPVRAVAPQAAPRRFGRRNTLRRRNSVSTMDTPTIPRIVLDESTDDHDDQPLIDTATSTVEQEASTTPVLSLEYQAEFEQLGENHDSGASFMVTIQAAESSASTLDQQRPRSGLDLVALLDVSGSMRHDDKLEMLKNTVVFVINSLTPQDRLSLVTFNGFTNRIAPLTCCTTEGKQTLLAAVEDLHARGGTNICGAVNRALRILEHRRMKNPVTACLLLTDGQDSTGGTDVLAPMFRKTQTTGASVHTFGFGQDHDAAVLERIAEGTQGSFSFIEELETVGHAFGGCLGNLTSVVAQDIVLTLQPTTASNVIRARTSYPIETVQVETSRGSIAAKKVHLKDLFAGERRDLVFDLRVFPIMLQDAPRAQKLLNVGCSYMDPLFRTTIATPESVVQVMRVVGSTPEQEPNIELDKQRNRHLAIDVMSTALAEGETENFEEVRAQCTRVVDQIRASASGADPFCVELIEQVEKCASRLCNTQNIATGGRAYTLSMTHSLRFQRSPSVSGSPMYRTHSSSTMANRASTIISGGTPVEPSSRGPASRLTVTYTAPPRAAEPENAQPQAPAPHSAESENAQAQAPAPHSAEPQVTEAGDRDSTEQIPAVHESISGASPVVTITEPDQEEQGGTTAAASESEAQSFNSFQYWRAPMPDCDFSSFLA